MNLAVHPFCARTHTHTGSNGLPRLEALMEILLFYDAQADWRIAFDILDCRKSLTLNTH